MASGSMTDLEEPILSDNDSWLENPETIDDLQRSDEKLMTGRSNQQTSPSRFNIFSSPARVVGLKTFNIVLSVATVITNVATNVTLPIFSQSLDNYSDPYYILFSSSLLFPFFFFFLLVISKFCNSSVSFRLKAPIKYVFVAGFMNALNGLLVVYASDPSRTPPALQAILSTSVIPYTVIARYVMIRKGVGVKRLVCTGVVLIGLFISMEPIIFNIDNEDSSSSGQHQSTASRVLWPACFLLGFLPVGVMNVLLEKVMKQEASSLLVNVWVNGFQFITVTLLFWTDFIPGFGMSSDPRALWNSLSSRFHCQFGADPNCSGVVGSSWLFVISYMSASVFGFLLLRYADGAIYLVVVQALVTPLGTLFWTLFTSQPYFHWHPLFDLSTGFTIAGLVIMMPAVVLYRYFGQEEEKYMVNQTDEDIQHIDA